MWFIVLAIGIMFGYTVAFLLTDDWYLMCASLSIAVFLMVLAHLLVR